MGVTSVGFKEWAKNEHIVSTASIDQLGSIRLGIDAEDYAQTLLLARPRESLLPAIGGMPFTLFQRVDDDLAGFREAGIEPVFLFSGLEYACQDRFSVLKESRKAHRALNDAWALYDVKDGDQAVEVLGQAPLYRIAHIVRSLQFYLHKQGVYTETAPYSAAPQLVHMERRHYIDAIAGSASCLVFGANRIITGFDWENKTFTWVGLTRCLSQMAVTHDQFTDICLLSGSSILPTLPELDKGSPSTKLTAARNLITRMGNEGDVLFHEHMDDHYRDIYPRARYAIKHPAYITTDGQIEPQNWEAAPGDAHNWIGQRLPDEIYFYLARGVVGPRVLDWRTRKEILETPPLDGGDSPAYKTLVQEKLRPLRARTLALLTRWLSRYYQKTDVEFFCWWNENLRPGINVLDELESARPEESWHVPAQSMPPNPTSDGQKSSLLYAIASLANEADAGKTISPRASDADLRSVEELRANSVWRFLQDRGYITSEHTLSAWGQALKVSLERATNIGLTKRGITANEAEESIFMAFELLRMNLLNGKQMFPAPPYTGAPTRGSDTDKSNTMLVSRVASLSAFHHSVNGYGGPLARHLLAYHQIAAAVRGSLRDLVEMHACNLLLSGAVDRSLKKDEYTELGATLPFANEPDAGLGLVVKCHLDEQPLPPKERTNVAGWFRYVWDTEADLQKAWKLWDAVNTGIQAAEGDVISAETKQSFKSTDEWLKLKTKAVPNGTA